MNADRYLELIVKYEGIDHADADEAFDTIAEAFMASTGLIDPDLAMDTEAQTFAFCAQIPEDVTTEREALMRVITAARSALHACGGITASWDERVKYLIEATVDEDLLIDA